MTKVQKEADAMVAADQAATTQQPAPQDAKRRPLKTISLGNVHVAVWARDVIVKGESVRFYSMSPERSYQDQHGTRYTRSFNAEDGGALMACIKDASDYINKLRGLVPSVGQD